MTKEEYDKAVKETQRAFWEALRQEDNINIIRFAFDKGYTTCMAQTINNQPKTLFQESTAESASFVPNTRTLLAMAAMQGIISNQDMTAKANLAYKEEFGISDVFKAVAFTSVQYANALLAELGRKEDCNV